MKFFSPFRLALAAFFTLLLCSSFILSSQTQDVPAYRNAKLPIEQRVADLLSRMTLEEKIAQIEGVWENPGFMKTPESRFVDDKGTFLPDHAAVLLKDGIGQMSRPSEVTAGPREMAEFTNAMQKWMKVNTRLGIPVLFHDECLHGHIAAKDTSYPAAIGLASTWDPALVNEVFTATAAEARAAACTSVWRRSSTWRAIRAGAARKKPMAKIRISIRASAWPPSKGFRVQVRPSTKRMS